jgi:hypothetical protein
MLPSCGSQPRPRIRLTPNLLGSVGSHERAKTGVGPPPLSIELRSIRAFSPQHAICPRHHSKHLRRLYKDVKLSVFCFNMSQTASKRMYSVALVQSFLLKPLRRNLLHSLATDDSYCEHSQSTRSKAQWLLSIPAVGQKLPGMLHAGESSFVCI